MQEWTQDKVQIKINFTDPLIISLGDERDTVYLNIKNPGLFVSEESHQAYDPNFEPVIKQTIPRQLPVGVDPKALQ